MIEAYQNGLIGHSLADHVVESPITALGSNVRMSANPTIHLEVVGCCKWQPKLRKGKKMPRVERAPGMADADDIYHGGLTQEGRRGHGVVLGGQRANNGICMKSEVAVARAAARLAQCPQSSVGGTLAVGSKMPLLLRDQTDNDGDVRAANCWCNGEGGEAGSCY